MQEGANVQNTHMPKATVETSTAMWPCVQSAWMRERLAASLPAWYASTSTSAQLQGNHQDCLTLGGYPARHSSPCHNHVSRVQSITASRAAAPQGAREAVACLALPSIDEAALARPLRQEA